MGIEKEKKMRIGVCGVGCVGSALCHLFETNGYRVSTYDKFKPDMMHIDNKKDINKCDFVFVCVPTPFKNGKVDISAVEECVSWIKAPNIVIKSTVPPGTTRRLAEKYKKRLFHNPEFLTEKNAKKDIFMEGRVIIGLLDWKDGEEALKIAKILEDCGIVETQIELVFTETSELIKYITNAFLATKVAFCNEMDLIARKFNLEWNRNLRRLFLLDKRVGDSHTIVTEERGFGGTCLPKDLDGLISFSNSKFFKAVKEQNERTKAFKDKT
jgi:UDPglucose 6-dehydrogenase